LSETETEVYWKAQQQVWPSLRISKLESRLIKTVQPELGMAVQACNPSTQKAEVGLRI
jgi:hypothetical protein